MISYLKKYWLEILTFGAIFAVLMVCVSPSLTWINTDSDGAHYVLSAKYFGVAHNTSAPLYLLLGRLFLYLPFGTDAWRMGLISVLATTIACIFIYKSVMVLLSRRFIQKYSKPFTYRIKNYYTDGNHRMWRACALVAALIYGSSALVITQSTIIETYALSTCLSVVAYYMCLKKRWYLSSIMLGLTLAIHPLFFGITWFVFMIAYKEMRNWKKILVTLLFLAFYAYIPLSRIYGSVPSMWGNSSFTGFFKNNFGTMWMLAGGIWLGDLPKRILDTIAILGVSMGFSLIVMVWTFIKGKSWRNALMWLFIIPVFYFIINLSAETYVYMIPAIAFGAIATGVGLSKIEKKRTLITNVLAVSLIGMLAYNCSILDIGRTLDPNLSAQKFYDEELPKMKDGDIYLGGGWTWAINYLYNREEGGNIIPVCTDILPSSEYLDIAESNGIKLIRTDSESFIDKQWLVAKSIAELNDNVWIAKETNPKTLEYELVPAKDNMYLIDRWLGYEKEPTIAWKPSNPYEFITGALEVGEWKFILKSNHNARLAIIWSIYGIGFVSIASRLFNRKNKYEAHKA